MNVCYIGERKEEFLSLAKEFARDSHQVFVIFPDEKSEAMKKEDGVWLIRIKTRNKTRLDYLNYRKKVKAMLEKLELFNHLDLIESSLVGAAAIFYQEERTIPIVINGKDCFSKLMEREQSSLKDEIQLRLLDWEREFVRNGDCLVIESEEAKEKLRKHYSVSPSKIKIASDELEKRKRLYHQVIRDFKKFSLEKGIDDHHEAS